MVYILYAFYGFYAWWIYFLVWNLSAAPHLNMQFRDPDFNISGHET